MCINLTRYLKLSAAELLYIICSTTVVEINPFPLKDALSDASAANDF